MKSFTTVAILLALLAATISAQTTTEGSPSTTSNSAEKSSPPSSTAASSAEVTGSSSQPLAQPHPPGSEPAPAEQKVSPLSAEKEKPEEEESAAGKPKVSGRTRVGGAFDSMPLLHIKDTVAAGKSSSSSAAGSSAEVGHSDGHAGAEQPPNGANGMSASAGHHWLAAFAMGSALLLLAY